MDIPPGFIALHEAWGDKPVFVRTGCVGAVVPIEDGVSERYGKSCIFLANSSRHIAVRETPDEVLALLAAKE